MGELAQSLQGLRAANVRTGRLLTIFVTLFNPVTRDWCGKKVTRIKRTVGGGIVATKSFCAQTEIVRANISQIQCRNILRLPFHFPRTIPQDKTHLQRVLNQWYGSVKQCWRLVYRASTDGFSAESFHRHCDGVSPTYVLVLVSRSNIITRPSKQLHATAPSLRNPGNQSGRNYARARHAVEI